MQKYVYLIMENGITLRKLFISLWSLVIIDLDESVFCGLKAVTVLLPY